MKKYVKIDWKNYLPLVRMIGISKEKHLAKGLSFGKRDYAIHKSDRLKLDSASIPSDCFVLHKCRYVVYGSLCRNKLADLSYLRDYLNILFCNANLEEKPTCRGYTSNQVVMSFCGFGLTPYHVRALLHRWVRISKLVVSRLEVKCFPLKSFLDSDELANIKSMEQAPVPANREKRKITTIAYNYYLDRKFILSAYDIESTSKPQVKSWGQNLEIIWRGRIDSSNFEDSVIEMCGILSSFAGNHIRPVSTVKSYLHYYPCGLLIESASKRDKDAVKTVISDALATVKSKGYIMHSNFVDMFSHIASVKSRQGVVSKYAKEFHLVKFYLPGKKSYFTKAWKMK